MDGAFSVWILLFPFVSYGLTPRSGTQHGRFP